MRGLVAIVAVVLLAGCATPPGKYKKEDLSSHERVVNASFHQAYDGLREYARFCGDVLGHIPEWYAKQDKAIVDLYVRGGFGGRSNDAFGVIELTPKGDKTSLWMGVVPLYGNPLFRPSGWWSGKIDVIFDSIERGEIAECQS